MKYIFSLCFLLTANLMSIDKTMAAPGSDSSNSPEIHQFNQMDINNDGNVSFEEFSDWHMHWLQWKFEKIDKNKDGYVSKNEYLILRQSRNKEKIESERIRNEKSLNKP